MQRQTIAIVFHSTDSHTARAARLLEDFLQGANTRVHLHNASIDKACADVLQNSDVIVFGSPTSYGTVSADFKKFMEATGEFWYKQLWKNKFAAGFTVSPFSCGDSINTLQTLANFAAYHSMHWISLGVLPRFINGQQTDGQNRFASFLGLMLQTSENEEGFHPGDLLTLELFAKRILDTLNVLNHKPNEYESNAN
jgi:NAD(P)H dehydrogenase (quinone)